MLENVSDAVLLAELKELVTKDNRLTARLLLHVGEVDARKLYLAEGYPSMFVYCVKALNMAESTAYKRINAARAGRRFPVIVDMVGGGDVHLTGVRLLSPHLNAENHAELLGAARHRSKRDIEQMVAERFPAPELPSSIRRLPETRAPQTALAAAAPASPRIAPVATDQPELPPAPTAPSMPGVPAAPAAPISAATSFAFQAPPRAPETKVSPVGPGRWRLQTTLSAETYEKLRRVQDLARQRLPDGDVAALLDLAFDALGQKLEAERFAVRRARKTSKSKSSGPKSDAKPQPSPNPDPSPAPPRETRSRHIPSETKRQVFARDGARCTFVGARGDRCTETGFLELDHLIPFARGGQHDPDLVSIRCRAHNQHAADRAYGRHFMDRKRRASRSPETAEPVAPLLPPDQTAQTEPAASGPRPPSTSGPQEHG